MQSRRAGVLVDAMRMPADNAGMSSQRADSGKQSDAVPEMAIRAWQGLAERLTPIIGERGFCVLYARSLHLTQPAFPCLVSAKTQFVAAEPFFTPLRQSLELHPALAADANRALLLTFTGLLNSLIGKELTARLVHGAPPGRSAEGRPQEPGNDR